MEAISTSSISSPTSNNNNNYSNPTSPTQQHNHINRHELLAQINDLVGINNENIFNHNFNNTSTSLSHTYSKTQPLDYTVTQQHNKTKQLHTTQQQQQRQQTSYERNSKIDYLSTVPQAPTVKFSKEARFQPYKQSNNSSDLLCSSSPGPIYNPSYTQVQKRLDTHTVEWRESKIAKLKRKQLYEQQQSNKQLNDYNKPTLLYPKVDYLADKRTAPRIVMGTTKRFNDDKTIDYSTQHSDTLLQPNHTFVEKTTPSYSFANPLKHKNNHIYSNDINDMSTTTHNAYIDTGLGPGEYNPQIDTIGHKIFDIAHNYNTINTNFGTEKRFDYNKKSQSQNTPGCQYNVYNSTLTKQQLNHTTGMAWKP